MERSKVQAIINAVNREVQTRKNEAGYSGEWGDRGAGNLKEKLDCWVSGINGEIPDCFNVFAAQAEKESDPEYQEFKRLEKKFS